MGTKGRKKVDGLAERNHSAVGEPKDPFCPKESKSNSAKKTLDWIATQLLPCSKSRCCESDRILSNERKVLGEKTTEDANDEYSD